MEMVISGWSFVQLVFVELDKDGRNYSSLQQRQIQNFVFGFLVIFLDKNRDVYSSQYLVMNVYSVTNFAFDFEWVNLVLDFQLTFRQ